MAVDLPTADQLYASGQSEMTARNPELTDFTSGSANDAYVGASVVVADSALRVIIDQALQQFVGTAEGDALDTRITDFGGPARNAASSALIPLRLTRDTYVGTYDVEEGDEFTKQAPNGQILTYTVTAAQAGTMGSGDATFDFVATATTTGRDHNVAAGGEAVIANPTLPAGLTVSQTDAAAGGAPEETDDAYRARFRDWFASRILGTILAIETGAKTVDGVSFAVVDETYIREADGGYVALYIGDPDAGSNDALAALVRAVIPLYRAAGIEVLVFGSAREEIAMAITVRTTSDSQISKDQVKAAAIAWADELRPNQVWEASRLETAIHDIARDEVLSADQTVPAARRTSPTAPQDALRLASDGSGITVTLYRVNADGTETEIT